MDLTWLLGHPSRRLPSPPLSRQTHESFGTGSRGPRRGHDRLLKLPKKVLSTFSIKWNGDFRKISTQSVWDQTREYYSQTSHVDDYSAVVARVTEKFVKPFPAPPKTCNYEESSYATAIYIKNPLCLPLQFAYSEDVV